MVDLCMVVYFCLITKPPKISCLLSRSHLPVAKLCNSEITTNFSTIQNNINSFYPKHQHQNLINHKNKATYLQNGANNPCGGAHRGIQHVHVIRSRVHLLSLPVAHQQSSRLVIEAITARDQFSKGARAREPRLQIQFFGSGVVESARNDVDNAIRDFQGSVEILRVGYHLVHHFPGFVVVGRSQAELFYLIQQYAV